MGFATKQLFDSLLHFRHAGLPADQNNFIDIRHGKTAIFQRRLARSDGPLNKIVDKSFELGTAELDVEVLWPVLVSRDEGQVDVSLRRRG